MEQKNNFLIPVAILIAGALIAWGLMSDSPAPKEDDPTQQASEELSFRPISKDDHILGDPQAEIIIIEYSDIECPYCKTFFATSKKIVDEFGKDGKVALVFRHFPLQGHVDAKPKAIATECVRKLGDETKFWEYIGKLFTEQISLEQLPAVAEQMGIDKDKFAKCIVDPAMEELVKEDFDDGVKAGVLGTATDPGGTPYSIIVTKDGIVGQIKGAETYEEVKMKIEEILAKEF
ncbi:DsbA family protein [Patescibacteria group bacterium]|nr:DsbA family protein [Patescibacteria group bacterium]MCG2694832.1 DsbA family protein [Candidatus Parcubacteria bacterium]